MSHSTVLVVIPDAKTAVEARDQLDDLLDPYDENKQVTGYPQWQDDDDVKHAVDFYREHPEYCPGENEYGPVKPFEAFVTEGNLEAWHEWTRQAVGAYCASDRTQGIYDHDKDRYGYLSTYNPNSKWDWWALGGRWNGSFLVNPGVVVGTEKRDLPVLQGADLTSGMEPVTKHSDAILGAGSFFGDDPETTSLAHRADLARKGDIDFETMRAEAERAANEAYDKFEEATKDIPVAPRFSDLVKEEQFEANIDPDIPWMEFMTDEEDVDVRRKAWNAPAERARERFAEDPWVKALREAKLDPMWEDLHDFWCVEGGRAAYVERERNDAGRTFALLIDGTWYEKGKMGWWGISTGDMPDDEWARRYWHRVDNLPDDVYLAVLDVHI